MLFFNFSRLFWFCFQDCWMWVVCKMNSFCRRKYSRMEYFIDCYSTLNSITTKILWNLNEVSVPDVHRLYGTSLQHVSSKHNIDLWYLHAPLVWTHHFTNISFPLPRSSSSDSSFTSEVRFFDSVLIRWFSDHNNKFSKSFLSTTGCWTSCQVHASCMLCTAMCSRRTMLCHVAHQVRSIILNKVSRLLLTNKVNFRDYEQKSRAYISVTLVFMSEVLATVGAYTVTYQIVSVFWLAITAAVLQIVSYIVSFILYGLLFHGLVKEAYHIWVTDHRTLS